MKDVQKELSTIEGLTLSDCLTFFNEAKDGRAKAIYDLCETGDEDFEVDTIHTSEGDDNGAYMMGWRWVPFIGTELDKHSSEGNEDYDR